MASTIQNLPAVLQPAMQQGFLEKEFIDGLESRLAFSAVCDVEEFQMGVGETITKTKTGLLAPVTTPLLPSANVGLDNGLTGASYGLEQYTISLKHYANTMDLNTVQQHLMIAPLAMEYSKKLGINAVQSMDRLARNALFDSHMGGNTRVRVTLGAPAATVSVDDIRGFEKVLVNGVQTAVSASKPLSVTIGADVYSCVGVAADGSNVSSVAFMGGKSGVLTLSANVTVSDGTAGNAVVAATAPTILRAGNRSTTAGLVATDLLTINKVLEATAVMRSNNVPTIDGFYHCYLSDVQLLELFQDQQFQYLYRGQYGAEAYQRGVILSIHDVKFIPTTEVFMQSLGGVNVRRAIVCGKGALVEGRFAGLALGTGVHQDDGVITTKDGITFVIREPLDRLQQQIAMSWNTIKDFVCPTDCLADPTIIPTATNSYFKRAIVIETA